MTIFHKLLIKYYLHSRSYEKILKIADCDLFDSEINKDKVKYQALSSFYLKNYYHSRKCYELLAEHNLSNYDDYNKLAYIYSRHNEKENAIIAWCKSLEKRSSNNPAEDALNYIKTKGREINLIEDIYFEELSCKEPVLIPFKKIFIITLIFVVTSLFLFFSVHYGPDLVKKIKLNMGRKEIRKVVIDDYNPNVLSEPPKEKTDYSYNENEVRKQFESIKDSIIKEDLNAAILLINKLRMSNASISVKAKLDILESFIEQPDYYKFKNTIEYRSIKENPELYKNIYIKWHGRIVNSVIDKKRKQIGFNLIMGDENNGLIDGIIPVIFDKAVIAENNKYATVFGIVTVENNKMVINGKYLIRD